VGQKMKKVVIGGSIIFGILLLLFVGVAGYFYFVIFGNNDRTLAKNVAVTSEWTEIKIDPPVTPGYSHQAIYVRPLTLRSTEEPKVLKLNCRMKLLLTPK